MQCVPNLKLFVVVASYCYRKGLEWQRYLIEKRFNFFYLFQKMSLSLISLWELFEQPHLCTHVYVRFEFPLATYLRLFKWPILCFNRDIFALVFCTGKSSKLLLLFCTFVVLAVERGPSVAGTITTKKWTFYQRVSGNCPDKMSLLAFACQFRTVFSGAGTKRIFVKYVFRETVFAVKFINSDTKRKRAPYNFISSKLKTCRVHWDNSTRPL